MKLLTYSLAAGLLSASIASADYLKPLMNPAELSNSLDQANPIILDIRGDAYQDGHISGAISAPYGLFRGPKNNPGQLLDEDVLEERFEALGLELDRPVVVVSEGKTDTDFGAAARVYWTLKSTGFEDLAILNGGKPRKISVSKVSKIADASIAYSDFQGWGDRLTKFHMLILAEAIF